MTSDELVRTARWFVDVVRRVAPDDWERPALGVWDVRALVGHTGRALTTVVEYLDRPAPPTADLATAGHYFAAFAATPDRGDVDRQVAERGVAAGAVLGDDPVGTVERWVSDVEAALSGVPGERVVATRVGAIRLAEYLRTRSFELVVHGTDVLTAIGATDDAPLPAVVDALHVATEAAALSGKGVDLLRALSGRGVLPAGYSVV
jgi:hypothetical protein